MVLTVVAVRGTQFRGAGIFLAYIINCAYIILADPRI